MTLQFRIPKPGNEVGWKLYYISNYFYRLLVFLKKKQQAMIALNNKGNQVHVRHQADL